MALYRRGTASMDADGTVHGTDTKWKDQLALIRVGATIVFLEQPIKLAVISDIVSDTELKAISTDGQTAANGKYVILLNDSLTVNGLAQNVAETLRYYQSKETEIAGAMDIIASLDMDNLNRIVEEIKANKSAAEAAQNQAELARDSANSARDESISIKNQTQQISDGAIGSINAAKDQAITNVQQKENSAVTHINSEEAAAIQAINDAKGDLSGYVNNAQTAAQTATSAKNDAQAARDASVSAKDAAAVSAQEAKDAASSVNAENLLHKDKNLSDLADKAASRNNLDVYSKSEVLDQIGIGETPRHMSDMNNPQKGFSRILGNGQTIGVEGFSAAGWIAQYDGTPSYSGMFVAPDGNRIFAGGLIADQNSGKWSWHEVPTLDRSNTFHYSQTISAEWPNLTLDVSNATPSRQGGRIVFENNATNSLIIFFAKKQDNNQRFSVQMQNPETTNGMYVGYQGGLAPNGTNAYTFNGAMDMNIQPQGWRNIGGNYANSMKPGSQVYGSLFTQCTQGLVEGNAPGANNPKQIWWQQRFYDTENNIYSRINTNAGAWGGWSKITMSAVSDERLKNILGNLNVEGALDNINRMEFKLFKFKEEKGATKQPTVRRGVISQQIRMIDKEYTNEIGGFYHLDQTPMLLDGLAAIKALRARDEENKKRIADLESRISAFEDMIKKLIENK